jgi:hypothetical protein
LKVEYSQNEAIKMLFVLISRLRLKNVSTDMFLFCQSNSFVIFNPEYSSFNIPKCCEWVIKIKGPSHVY